MYVGDLSGKVADGGAETAGGDEYMAESAASYDPSVNSSGSAAK